jgi:hypothetical protein
MTQGHAKVTVQTLRQMKADGERITMVTCYDASFARLCDQGADGDLTRCPRNARSGAHPALAAVCRHNLDQPVRI